MESLDPDTVGKLLHFLDLSTLVSSYRQSLLMEAWKLRRSELRRCCRSKTSPCWW